MSGGWYAAIILGLAVASSVLAWSIVRAGALFDQSMSLDAEDPERDS